MAEFSAGCGGVRGLALADGSTVAVAPLRLEAEAAAPLRPMATAPACLVCGYACGTRSPGYRTAAPCPAGDGWGYEPARPGVTTHPVGSGGRAAVTGTNACCAPSVVVSGLEARPRCLTRNGGGGWP
jgi:hypothetical protein